MTISKRDIRSRLGFQTNKQLAEWFGISEQAVAQWPEDGSVPELRRLQAESKRPDLFRPDAAPPQPASEVA